MRWKVPIRKSRVQPDSLTTVDSWQLVNEEFWEGLRDDSQRQLKRKGKHLNADYVSKVRQARRRSNVAFARRVAKLSFTGFLGILAIGLLEMALNRTGITQLLIIWIKHGAPWLGFTTPASALPSSGSLGLAAVQIAGISLPLFYTLLSTTMRQSYADAPESVREFALERPFIKLFENSAWVLGIWGIFLVAVSETSYMGGPIVRATVTGLGAMVIVAIAVGFWKVLTLAKPWTLLGDMRDEMRRLLELGRTELESTNHPVALGAIRDGMRKQLQLLVDHSRFVLGHPTSSTFSAHMEGLVAVDVATAYGPFQGRMNTDSEWYPISYKHPSLIKSGGPQGPTGMARVAPEPIKGRDRSYIEKELATTMANALREASRFRDEKTLGTLLIWLEEPLKLAARARLETAFQMHSILSELLSEFDNPDNLMALALEDGLTTAFTMILEGIASRSSNVDDLVANLHSEDRTALLPRFAGERLQMRFHSIRDELERERSIEGSLVTRSENTRSRLQETQLEEAREDVIMLLTRLEEFIEYRVETRPEHSGTAGFAPILHSYHLLGRIQRRFGRQLPTLPFERPQYTLEDAALRAKASGIQWKFIMLGTRLVSEVRDFNHDDSMTDLVGMLYYYSMYEAIDRFMELDEGLPEDAPGWLRNMLVTTWNAMIRVLHPDEQDAPDAARIRAAKAMVRESLRVTGYALLVERIQNPHGPHPVEEAAHTALSAMARHALGNQDATLTEVANFWNQWLASVGFDNFPYGDVRFQQDVDIWDRMAKHGWFQPSVDAGYDATDAAQNNGSRLVIAMSRDTDDIIHEMDAVTLAVMADRWTLDEGSLGNRVEDVRRMMRAPHGKWGPRLAALTNHGGEEE